MVVQRVFKLKREHTPQDRHAENLPLRTLVLLARTFEDAVEELFMMVDAKVFVVPYGASWICMITMWEAYCL